MKMGEDWDWEKHWKEEAEREKREKSLGRKAGLFLLLAFLLFVMCDELPDANIETPTCSPHFAC